MLIRSINFQAQKVCSLKPTHDIMLREMYAVVVPVTANVQSMKKSWEEETFHFCCSLLNMMQREGKICFLSPMLLHNINIMCNTYAFILKHITTESMLLISGKGCHQKNSSHVDILLKS